MSRWSAPETIEGSAVHVSWAHVTVAQELELPVEVCLRCP